MSNYRSFIQDFPQRCQRILSWAAKPAMNSDSEVTLMLMAASAGFLMPYERLKPGGKYAAHADRDTYSDASGKLDKLRECGFVGSDLWDARMSSWGMGGLDSMDGGPDQWPALQQPPVLPPDTKCDTILTTIRHALAHANVYTRVGMKGEIREIVFICHDHSHGSQPLRFLRVKPRDFLLFLHSWFSFTGGLHLPQDVIVEALEEAG